MGLFGAQQDSSLWLPPWEAEAHKNARRSCEEQARSPSHINPEFEGFFPALPPELGL
jgi:hypothetical protein